MIYFFSAPGSRRSLTGRLLLRCNPSGVLISYEHEKNLHSNIGLINSWKSSDVRLFVDSGAFGAWNSGKVVSISAYSNLLQRIIGNVYKPHSIHCASLDVIPVTGSSNANIIRSSKQSLSNYISLSRLFNTDVIVPIYHYGDPFWLLQEYINTRPDVIGISPANDTNRDVKLRFISESYNFISKFRNFQKIHLFGVGLSDLRIYSAIPVYSTDSISYKFTSLLRHYSNMYNSLGIDSSLERYIDNKVWVADVPQLYTTSIKLHLQIVEKITEYWLNKGVSYE